jgi:hypothetical protein
MGFFDKFKRKGHEKSAASDQTSTGQQQQQQPSSPSGSKEGRRVKKYTSDGKPIYE